MANEDNLTPFKKGEERTVKAAHLGGLAKAGTKHLSTQIREMLNDENFELKLANGKVFKEAPMKAIIKTAIAKAISGDTGAMEWLARHGYGNKLLIELEDPRRAILAKYGVIDAQQIEEPKD